MTDRQLFLAVGRGDCEKVKQLLLGQGLDVNQAPRHQKGFTPLMRACQKGDLKMITVLIENGASLESPAAEDGSDPLIIACEIGDLEIVQFLFEKGSSLQPISRTPKKTALSSVCEKGDFEIAKFLVEKGATVDQTKRGGESPLWICCERGDIKMANLLIDNKAKVDWSTNEGETSLCRACKRGDFEMAQFLINKGADVNFSLQRGVFYRTSISWTPLCVAVLEKNIKMVDFLLEKGANPNVLSKDEMSPFHIACQKGYLEIVKSFLKIEDLQIDQPGNQGTTALCEATQRRHFDIITLLVERGASINFENRRIHTPFHIACKLGDLKIVSFFIKHGAQLKDRNSDGLVLACEKGNMDVISYLLENMKEELNVGPLCFASRRGKFDLAQFLISKNCPINGVHNQFFDQSPLTLACMRNNLDIAELLLQNGAHLIVQGKSILHRVCGSSFVTLPIVKFLVENGADVNEIYQDSTPLMALLLSTRRGPPGRQNEIILFMLKNGVQINKTNQDGSTALHVAAQKSMLETVKLLCEYGADPEIKNNLGQTPADTTYSLQVKKFLEEYIHIDGSIKPAKRDGNEKIESNGKEEEQRKGEEQKEEGEERESKKRKVRDECGFGDEIEFKKPRMD